MLTSAIFTMVMATAMVWDVRTNRIPNIVIGIGVFLAVALQGVSGFGALGATLLGGGVALVVGFSLFALGAIGGGDAKLFMVVGAFMGPVGFFYAFLASAIVGGVLAIAVAVRRGVVVPVLLGCKDLVINAFTFGRAGMRPSSDKAYAVTVPYGAAIALGSVATWFLLPRAI